MGWGAKSYIRKDFKNNCIGDIITGTKDRHFFLGYIVTVTETEKIVAIASLLSKRQNHTDKKENTIFLLYKKIQKGSGAKPY